MKNLHRVVAALLMVPVLALNANPLMAGGLPGGEDRSTLTQRTPASTWCWVLIGGRWYYIPC